ncbi:uncharacterized protein LOC128677268 [Plodia interpunctella]|uniref:uncharacterized protein LOC128677268 n=1 Tax=Plodia interpunctella TaxID=58824 RepID=UPI002368082C|nr:uncharacterized protein LOC128677268 [Plodia interpunctella]
MWITLLFIAQVSCEWVQISQQHYRKPYRPYDPPFLTEDGDYDYEEDSTSKPNTMYTNKSIDDYKWTRSDLPRKGFVTKVEADEEYIIRSDKNTGLNNVDSAVKNFKVANDRHDKPVNDKEVSTKNLHNDEQDLPHTGLKIYRPAILESQEDVFEESYHVIPNMGSIKKVQLDSRTVRTPILNEMSRKQYGTSSSHNMKPPVSERAIFSSRPVIVWKSDNNTKAVVPGIVEKVSKEDIKLKSVENISRYEEIPLHDDHSKIGKIFMTHVVPSSERMSGESDKLNQLPDINFEKPVFVTKEEFEDEGLVSVSIDDTAAVKTTEYNKKSTNEAFKPDIKNKTEDLPTNDKVNTIEKVLKFMRIVTDTISRNTRRSVGSKVRYLENLQDTIMANIEHRIDTLWPNDDHSPTQSSRKVRSAETKRGGGHVEFPSSESALMTISFLTFAVYLIKLVLQVIHTYKNKAMMMTPTVVTTVGRTVAAVFRRNEFP